MAGRLDGVLLGLFHCGPVQAARRAAKERERDDDRDDCEDERDVRGVICAEAADALALGADEQLGQRGRRGRRDWWRQSGWQRGRLQDLAAVVEAVRQHVRREAVGAFRVRDPLRGRNLAALCGCQPGAMLHVRANVLAVTTHPAAVARRRTAIVVASVRLSTEPARLRPGVLREAERRVGRVVCRGVMVLGGARRHCA